MQTSTLTANATRGILLLAVAALAQGCAERAPPRPPTRQYAVDQAGGAKSCAVQKFSVVEGKEAPVAMTVGNDGGWCAVTVAKGGKPYGAGLLADRPDHGKVYIHTVGDDTRIDYTPAHGYAGTDKFAITLVPGDATLTVAVTVNK